MCDWKGFDKTSWLHGPQQLLNTLLFQVQKLKTFKTNLFPFNARISTTYHQKPTTYQRQSKSSKQGNIYSNFLKSISADLDTPTWRLGYDINTCGGSRQGRRRR